MSNLESNLPASIAPAAFDTWIRDLAQIVDGRVPAGTADDLVALDGTGGFKTVDSGAYAPASGQYAVNTVAASGADETLPATFPAHDVTMDVDCTFTFGAPTAGHTFILRLAGAFTPTFPASVVWDGGTAPTYATPSVYAFTTLDAGTTWHGSLVGSAFS